MPKAAIIQQAEVLSETQISKLSHREVWRLAERMPEERDKRLRQMHAEGMDDNEIADEFGCTRERVGQLRRGLGLAAHVAQVGGRKSFPASSGKVVDITTMRQQAEPAEKIATPQEAAEQLNAFYRELGSGIASMLRDLRISWNAEWNITEIRKLKPKQIAELQTSLDEMIDFLTQRKEELNG